MKPRDMRVDAQASMLHYFNLYAIRDRCNTSNLSDIPPPFDADTIQVEKIIPTKSDYRSLLSNFAILVCHVLKKHTNFFASFGSGVERHI